MTPASAITDARIGLGRSDPEIPTEVRAELFSRVTELATLRERIAETCAKLERFGSRAECLTAREVHASVSGAALQLLGLFRGMR